jgi:hypothetical protein
MAPASNDEREIRAARNQAMFRLVNEKIRELNDVFAVLTETVSIACECADGTCIQLIEIAPAVYDGVRANPRQFVVVSDHADPDSERIVSESDRYTVVENTRPAAETSEAADPRRSEPGLNDGAARYSG